MNIFRWFKDRAKKEEEIDIGELQKKLEKLKPKLDNSHNKEYHDKLNELLQSQINSRDNFINWIAGLTTGAMFFIFANISSTVNYLKILILAGGIFFATIISAILFKIFLEVRYGPLILEVKLLRNLWEGYDLRSELKGAKIGKSESEVDEGAKRKFLRNFSNSLNFIDPNHIEKLKRPITFKSYLLAFFIG